MPDNHLIRWIDVIISEAESRNRDMLKVALGWRCAVLGESGQV